MADAKDWLQRNGKTTKRTTNSIISFFKRFMTTTTARIVKIDTDGLRSAGELLRKGKLVAFPTGRKKKRKG